MLLTARTLAVLTCALAAADAAAAPAETFAIDLNVEPSERPELVCVIHSHAPDGRRVRMSKTWFHEGTGLLLESPAIDACTDMPDAQRRAAIQPALERLGVHAVKGAKQYARAAWAGRADVCGDELPACLPSISVTLPDSDDCTQRPLITCATNTQAPPGPGRVLVLQLQSTPPGRSLEGLFVDGAVVTFTLSEPPRGTNPTVSMTTAGGDYEEGQSGGAVGQRIRLTARPRCVFRDLAMPPVQSDEPLVVRLHVSDPVTRAEDTAPGVLCVAPWQETQRLWLPRGAPGIEKIVTGYVLAPSGSREVGRDEWSQSTPTAPAEATRFEVRWTSEEPPESLSVRVRSTTFGWTARCEYPYAVDEDSDCPEAALVQAGISCRATHQPGTRRCSYRCPANTTSSSGFELPQTVTFSVPAQSLDGEQAWRESLAEANQSFAGYTAPAFRQVPVHFCPGMDLAARAKATGDRIDRVRIRSGRGVSYDLEPGLSDHVLVPGAACGDHLTYEYVGDRRYAEGLVDVDSGRLVIPSPSEQASQWYVGAFLGGGFGVASDETKWAPEGAAQIAFQIRPFALPRWTFELHVEHMVTTWSYHVLESKLGSGGDDTRRVSRNYTGGRIAVGLHAWPLAQFVLGWGLGFAAALLEDDEAFIGDADFFWTASLTARLRLSRSFAFEPGFRAFLQQSRRSFGATDFRFDGESPVTEPGNRASFQVDLIGLRYWYL